MAIKRGLLLAEDEALKAKLSNITVAAPREGDGRKRAKVWFGFPDQERERSYPYITIDLIDLVFANDRAHSAQLNTIDYWPSEYATFAEWAEANSVAYNPTTQWALAREFHPYNIIYQVATHARTAQHDRELMATLIGTAYLPDRWGYLQVPADGSERHLIREGFSTADYIEPVAGGGDGKRVFRKVYNVSVTAEIPPENPFIYYQVVSVLGTLTTTPTPGLTEAWTNT